MTLKNSFTTNKIKGKTKTKRSIDNIQLRFVGIITPIRLKDVPNFF